ncbi:MAG: sugar phosphate isomerase/epimerase family protein [Christensenellales bacterium]
MRQFPIGVLVDSFRLPFAQGVRKAAQVGVSGLQVYATGGEMAPENLDRAKRADIRKLLSDEGLTISALCGDLGGHGFAVAGDNPARIECSCRIVDLAKDLGCDVITTHIGVIPADPNHPRYAVLQQACRALGEYAESVGAFFAIETGPEPCARLKTFLESLGTRGVRVNLDPANLVMVSGDDPVAGTRLLGDWIVHTHAKDGVMLQKSDPEVIYDMFAGEGIEGISDKDFFREVPLGQGQVDYPGWLKALEDIGYAGYLTIEREVGEDPEGDIRAAVGFLKGLMQ